MKTSFGLPLSLLALVATLVVRSQSDREPRPESRDRPSLQRELRQPAPPREGILVRNRGLRRQPKRSVTEALEARAERRAYEGAPPVMPHSAIFGEGTKECLDCHTVGMKLGNRIAHPMSHAPLANCVQCHVESEHREFSPAEPSSSSFRGFRSLRASASPHAEGGPPPYVPHKISMRGQCLSCHGPFGHSGLQTSHPERSNCVQCHIPDTSYRGVDER